MNPITEMKQRKSTQHAVNRANHALKGESKATTPPTVKNAHKGKLTLSSYPQLSYLFQQAKWGAANCKVNYADCFHFKQVQRKELIHICKILAGSDRLLQQLAAETALTDEQRDTVKQHKRLVGYLTRQMQSVVDYINQVEQADGEALNALCYRQE